MSTSGVIRCFICRNVSRMALLTRFRATALPTFLDAMIPSLFLFKPFGIEKNGAKSSNALLFTFGKNFLKLRSSCKPFNFGKRIVTHYFRFSGGKSFSSFSSAISQNTSAANGSTSFSETVYAFSFDIAGLKCSFHQSFLLKNTKNPHLSTKSDV